VAEDDIEDEPVPPPGVRVFESEPQADRPRARVREAGMAAA
jgi:hypothetical protein